MKVFLLILVYIVQRAYGIPSCSRELRKFTSNNAGCMTNAYEVQKLVTKTVANEMVYEQLSNIIRLKCTAANSINCYNDILEPVHGRCNDIPALQEIRNLYKMVLVFNEHVCQDNGTIFMEFLGNGGGECYNNQSKKTCYEDAQLEAHVSPFGITSLLDSHICGVLEADSSCLYHYDDCENTNVKKVYTQILQKMKQKFNCI